MKGYKKLLALLLSVVMIIGATACNDGNIESSKDNPQSSQDGTSSSDDTGSTAEMPAMTTDEITLTYATWFDWELFDHLATKFNEKYPNITVEIVQVPLEGYDDALLNLASSGQMPDLYNYLNVDIPIRNGWLGDMTEYFEADPEAKDMHVTLQKLGYLDGKRKFTIACKYLPMTIYLDRTVFEKLNVEMPDYDWTYQEMLDLTETMTAPDQGIFGYYNYLGIITMAPVLMADTYGEFGFDGEKYDLVSHWADAVNRYAEDIRLGRRAPAMGSEEWAAVSGDANQWPGLSGRVAIQQDAWWTLRNIYIKDEAVNMGIDMVPYVVPKGDGVSTNHKPGWVDFGAISSATDYPREAYEALKWFNWGKDGWLERLDAYEWITDANGELIYPMPDCLPLIGDQEVWDGIRTFYPDDPAYDAFFELCREPIPLGGCCLPGFSTFLSEAYFNGDYSGETNVEAAVINGIIDAHDVAQELTDKANASYNAVMDEFYEIYGNAD